MSMIEQLNNKLIKDMQIKYLKHFNSILKEPTKDAFSKIYRHFFVPKLWNFNDKDNIWTFQTMDYNNPYGEHLKEIYVDTPLVINVKDKHVVSTSSQPSLMAYMIDLADINKNSKVLEIGTGSGYNAAVISEIVGQENVITVEIERDVYEKAAENLKRSGKDIHIEFGDGGRNYSEFEPYDSVIVTCATPDIPWLSSLNNGGTVVIPLLTRGLEMLCRFEKKDNILVGQPKLPVRFLTFTGINKIFTDEKKEMKSLERLLLKADHIEDLAKEINTLSPLDRISFLYYLSLFEEDAFQFISENPEVPTGHGLWKKTLPYGISLISGPKVIHYGDASVIDKLSKHFQDWKKRKLKYSDYTIEVYPNKMDCPKDDRSIIIEKRINQYKITPKK